MQSTALASAMDLIDAMISLKAENPTNAESQFNELKSQLVSISAETLNGTNSIVLDQIMTEMEMQILM